MNGIESKSARDLGMHIAVKWGKPFSKKTGVKGIANIEGEGHGAYYVVPEMLANKRAKEIAEELRNACENEASFIRVAYERGYRRGRYYNSEKYDIPEYIPTREVVELEEDLDWALIALFTTPEQLDKMNPNLSLGKASELALDIINKHMPHILENDVLSQELEKHKK